ncbi:defensin coprisin-like [Venturia canescens]|uniref:defensin coprisin-like n=1 Tax=Venturia canescens TaxID=32260 RepID=UPI001C9D5478|nr:defensin coprisin-like [Venturia canescens]
MKQSLVILVVAVVAASMATLHELPQPAPSDIGPLMSVLSPQRCGQPLVRQKRLTCDLLSFGVDGISGFNHAACATKCLAQRHWGGYCEGPNCKCVEKKW